MALLRVSHHDSTAGTILRQGGNPNPAVNWPVPTDYESDDVLPEPKPFIELHGSAYIAFCKRWSPLFVAPEEDEEIV